MMMMVVVVVVVVVVDLQGLGRSKGVAESRR